MSARDRNTVVSERAIALVRSRVVSARWLPARAIAERSRALGVGGTIRHRALRALVARGEVEARGQTWAREYRLREKQGDE